MKGFITFAVRLLALGASFPSVVVGNLSLFKKGNDNNGSPTKFLGDDNNNIAREGRTANTFRTATAGFTLIELLVVVLIIGILSAVALPQYEKAVEKSRATEAMTILKALREQQSLCILDKGTLEGCMQDMGEGSLFDYANITIPGAINNDCGDPTCGPVTKNFSYALDGEYIYARRIINGEEVYVLETTAGAEIGCWNIQDETSKNWCKVIGFTKKGEYSYFQP